MDPVIAGYDEKGEFPEEIVNTGLEMGLQSLDFPEEWGGAGLSTKTACVTFEELAKHDTGVACAFSVTGTAIAPVMKYGTDARKRWCRRRFLRRAALPPFA